jgi:hypothetical protein
MTNHNAAQNYPLSWPTGWRRTPRHLRQRAKFSARGQDISVWGAVQRLSAEIERLGGRNALLSTNLTTRLDGLPYSNQKDPDDPGAAVYFTLKGQPRCLACDTWTTVAGNIAALAAHIDALRRIDRYGVGTLEQAFAGYAALPAPAADWRSTFYPDGTPAGVTLDAVERRYRELALTAHPDKGGTDEAMARLNVAIDSARAELGEMVGAR